MSKAILIIDKMPQYCNDCKFVADSFGYCELKKDRIPEYNFWSDFNRKSDWCPLKELPKKKKFDKSYRDVNAGFICGWNACLDEIGGE